MPVSVSVSVWMRVSARQIPLDPPPLVSSPNADPPIILAKCPTYILMPGPIVLAFSTVFYFAFHIKVYIRLHVINSTLQQSV